MLVDDQGLIRSRFPYSMRESQDRQDAMYGKISMQGVGQTVSEQLEKRQQAPAGHSDVRCRYLPRLLRWQRHRSYLRVRHAWGFSVTPDDDKNSYGPRPVVIVRGLLRLLYETDWTNEGDGVP